MMKKFDAKNTVLVVDKEGRGAALVDKYAQSEYVKKVISVPGNDLMKINTDKIVQIFPQLKTDNIPEILKICKREDVSLVDVAQDNAVEAGLVDILTKNGIPVVGPTRNAGQIEWDKVWSRKLGAEIGLPQPKFKICSSLQEGISYIKNQEDKPRFIKYPKLAEGKGAKSAKNNAEAIKRIYELKKTYGKSAEVFLIEEWLTGNQKSGFEEGEEFSVFAVSDGKRYKIIGSAQDHKRLNDYDEGENTGGMGCNVSPLVLTPEIMVEVDTIFNKTFKALSDRGRPYKGVLYLGAMAVRRNNKLKPYVIEFNARWGDPEAQVIIPGIKNDLFEIGMAIAKGDISDLNIKIDKKVRVAVAGVSRRYPNTYKLIRDKQIFGLDKVKKINGVSLYGAGVREENGKYFTQGGRLFYIVGEGKTVIDARTKAYRAMSTISIAGNNLHFRTDIGWRDLERLRKDLA